MNSTNHPAADTTAIPAALAGKLLLTGRELASRLGVSHRKIEDWTATGVIPALRLSPRMVRYELPAVLAALRQYQTATLK